MYLKAIKFNSKDVKKGDLFISFYGKNQDKYILDALNKKASLVITNSNYIHEKVIRVLNLDKEIISILDKYYNYPLKNTKLKRITILRI